MTNDANERPLDARPAARPAPKPEEPISTSPETTSGISTDDSSAEKKPFTVNLWSLNVALWNVVWIIIFLSMGFGVIEQQMPVGGMNITYNTCSFGELEGSCSDTGGSRVMYIGLALVLTYVFIRGVQKRIKRGY